MRCKLTEGSHPGEHLAIALTGGGEGSRFDDPILLIHDRCDVKILMGIHAADDATCSFVYRHSQPPALTSTNGFAGPNARTGQSRDHEGQALLGSQASARQSLTARRSRAVDRSRERHGWSIGVRVRPHRAPHGASLPVGRSVFESGRPETGRYPLTVGVEDLRLAELRQRLLERRQSRTTTSIVFDSRQASTARDRPVDDRRPDRESRARSECRGE